MKSLIKKKKQKKWSKQPNAVQKRQGLLQAVTTKAHEGDKSAGGVIPAQHSLFLEKMKPVNEILEA